MNERLYVVASAPLVQAEACDALVLPGGRAPEYLRLNPTV
jgi:putative intracellular protease/amidase